MEHITGCALPLIQTACKITVCLSNEIFLLCTCIHYAIISSSCYVSQNYFSSTPMCVFWSFHKYGNQTHSLHNIWSCTKSWEYLFWKIKIHFSDCATSMPRKYFMRPRFFISSYFIMAALNSSNSRSPVKIISSTYR